MFKHPSRYPLVTAVMLALLASSPASAQLDQRLTEAGQKLDSDIQGCRPIDVSDYANLLKEAVENKQRANRAARRGAPIDQTKVDGDLASAQSLFNRANAAQVQQCIRQATQPQTQPQPQTSASGATAGASQTPAVCPSAAPPVHSVLDQIDEPPPPKRRSEGMSNDDVRDISEQQRIIDNTEQLFRLASEAYDRGDCEAREALLERLRQVRRYRDALFPQQLLDEWNRRLDAEEARPPKACPPCPDQPSTLAPPQPLILDAFARRILDVHNGERATLGLQPFYWNQSLAEGAKAHAQHLARTGVLAHASREGRGTARENLSQGLASWTTDQMLDNWLKEKRFFIAGTFPNVSATGDWYAVGHYSQMIWPETTDIGCGISTGSGYQWLVCRYSPGGNRDGRPVGLPPLPPPPPPPPP